MLTLETGMFLGVNRRRYDAGEVVISETEYRERVFEGWHSHENHHITFIVRGGNREQRKNQELEVSPGTVIYYRSGELHRNTQTLHPSRNLNLEIKDAFLSKYQASFRPSLTPSPDTKFCFLKIYQECRTNDAHTIASVHALVLQLLSASRTKEAAGAFPPWIASLREVIHDRWNETLSLADLASLLQVHPVTISKKFPRYFSCTLGEYMRKVKVEKAIALIQGSPRHLVDIAYQCGFADQSHFIRAFKAATGFSPGEYQRFISD